MSTKDVIDASSDRYEDLLAAVIENDEKTIKNILQYSSSEAKKVSQLLWKILSSIDRRDLRYHLGVTILRGVIEDWCKNLSGLRFVTNYEKLFRSIIAVSSDSWKNMNACECPAVRTAVVYWHKKSLQMFAESGMNLSECKGDGESLLHLVSLNKKEPKNKHEVKKLIECLIRHGCGINAMSKNWTPLHYAVSNHHHLIVEVLIELSADVNANDENNWPYTPLVLAILSESDDSAKMLIAAGANVNCSTKSGRTPLYFASERGDTELVDMLMKHGANVNFTKNGCKSSALHVAAAGGHVKIVQKLINARADVNARDEDGRTPLHFASQSLSKGPTKLKDHATVVKILIKSKADVNAVDKEGNSPLHMAANSGSSEIVSKLLKFKVEHFRENAEGMTPLHAALQKRWSKVAIEDRCNNGYLPSNSAKKEKEDDYYKDAIVLLIKASADKKTSQYFGSLLYLASEAGDPWSVKLLMDYGANVNVIVKTTKSTALHAAIKNNQVSVISKLINGGAKVNVKDIRGRTPLHMAIMCPVNYRIQIVPIILKANARMDLQDNDGYLPLDIAINNDDVESLKLLLEVDGEIGMSICYRIWDMPSMKRFSDSNISWIRNHLVKMFSINSNSRAKAQCLTFKSNNNLNECYNCYSTEVNELKAYFIGETVSLYDFLNMNIRRRSSYTKNIDLCSCAKKFPQYYEIIKNRCHEAIERRLLMESAKLSLCKLTNFYLPDVCVEYILDFLRNIQLKMLIQSAS